MEPRILSSSENINAELVEISEIVIYYPLDLKIRNIF